MISVRLLFLIASVLFITDSKDDIWSQKCLIEWYFCVHAKHAHEYNKDARIYLGKLQDLWGKPPNSTKRLGQAEEAILRSLNEINPETIVELMIKALVADCRAFFSTKLDCFRDKTARGERKDMLCRGAYHMISRAIASIVSATIKVHPDKKKKAKVKRIFRDFYTQFPNRSLDAANEAYKTGQKVIDALKAG